MDSFTKIITGYVKQHFEFGIDGKFICVSQEFIAGDDCSYVDDSDIWIVPPDYVYQSYTMTVV